MRSLKPPKPKKVLRILYCLYCKKLTFAFFNEFTNTKQHLFFDSFLEYFILVLFSSIYSHIHIHMFLFQFDKVISPHFVHASLFCAHAGILHLTFQAGSTKTGTRGNPCA